ncbi:CoA transferase [Rubrobacter marinus]|uniref:CoA transferase n=1 Tax=Rubrobacter marinus TaxID=2653852 RepID=A0A6G8Q325_9ACTN|nr:CoA transferase [Rubrobacter marinus]
MEPSGVASGPLSGLRIVTLAVNVPGPAAAARLRGFGASVVKVEPPSGDPLMHQNTAWYRALSTGQEVVRLNLKEAGDFALLEGYLAGADLFLTSSRTGALERLGLDPDGLRRKHPRLCGVAITGYPSPRGDEPGHDLTYLADHGLLTPPEMPRSLLADLAGAERAVSEALALLIGRERGIGEAGAHVEVPLSEAAAYLAEPLRYGITAPGAHLGGGFAGYGLYEASDGWIAVAALEPHFWEKLRAELGLGDAGREDLEGIFRRETAAHWEDWASARDLPVAALKGTPPDGRPGTEHRTTTMTEER